jgi:hypothetical protein
VVHCKQTVTIDRACWSTATSTSGPPSSVLAQASLYLVAATELRLLFTLPAVLCLVSQLVDARSNDLSSANNFKYLPLLLTLFVTLLLDESKLAKCFPKATVSSLPPSYGALIQTLTHSWGVWRNSFSNRPLRNNFMFPVYGLFPTLIYLLRRIAQLGDSNYQVLKDWELANRVKTAAGPPCSNIETLRAAHTVHTLAE